jgi:hypothetical protein
VLVGWLDLNAKVPRAAVFQIARWKDGAWTQVGELGGGQPISDPRLAISSLGPVAVWREGRVVCLRPEEIPAEIVEPLREGE